MIVTWGGGATWAACAHAWVSSEGEGGTWREYGDSGGSEGMHHGAALCIMGRAGGREGGRGRGEGDLEGQAGWVREGKGSSPLCRPVHDCCDA